MRRKQVTKKAIRRIAEIKIQTFSLRDTPEEYIAKCMAEEDEILSKQMRNIAHEDQVIAEFENDILDQKRERSGKCY
jgi:tRNA U34 2-thiouridine synthase MnmA/TrmU|tara:strand:- start:61 stop:291 length:231 start_codon:yes stop_codon:yes gene_type:complete